MITKERILAEIDVMDYEAVEVVKAKGRFASTDFTMEIQGALSECKSELDVMYMQARRAPIQAVFGMGIQLGYRLARAESLEKMVGGDSEKA